MAKHFVYVELPIGVAWWLYHEVVRAHAEEGHSAWSPLSDVKVELEYALHALEKAGGEE